MRAEITLPNAMTLATAGADALPTARMVLLKGFDDRGFVFFSNYDSRKGKQLASNPNAALVFYWSELERQVGITGGVTRLEKSESEEYFDSRPLGSRIGAWASPQSEVIPGRGGARAARGRTGRQISVGRHPIARPLGWIQIDTEGLRVLAEPPEPPTRPLPLQPRIGHLANHPPSPLTLDRRVRTWLRYAQPTRHSATKSVPPTPSAHLVALCATHATLGYEVVASLTISSWKRPLVERQLPPSIHLLPSR